MPFSPWLDPANADLTSADLTGLGQVSAALALLILAGRALTGGRGGPGLQGLVGWGALCLLLTLWGVAMPASLRWPALGFAVLAVLGGLAQPHRRDDALALGRMLVLALPMLAIVATMRASQPDIFLNLLPNAAYLVDHAAFPTQDSAPSYSYLPVAPYNTQFVPFLGSLFGGGLAANGLALFTVLLHPLAGLIFARILGAEKSSWGFSALGLLLATLLDPGFVPRISFAGYGEAPLAVTLLGSGWLAARSLQHLAEHRRWPASLAALALVLAALVNIKQQGIGLLLALSLAAILVASLDARIGWRAGVRGFGVAALPALLLYAAWRGFVLVYFPDGELQPLPIEQWQWQNLPAIIGSILGVLLEKPVLFAFVVFNIALFALNWRRGRRDAASLVQGLASVTFLFYNGFLVLTYIGHFPGVMSLEAHSYFRYNTHLSLLLLLGVALEIGRRAPSVLPTRPRRHAIGIVLVGIMLLAPIGFAQRLRFDLEPPQPLIRALARNLAAHLKPDDRLALLLPGDNGSTGTALAAALRYEQPRRPSLDLKQIFSADPAAAVGYSLAFLSCTDGNTLGLPAHAAALLAQADGGWRMVDLWPYPPVPPGQRWNGNLAGAPLCHP
jgi:hypothetical protein